MVARRGYLRHVIKHLIEFGRDARACLPLGSLGVVLLDPPFPITARSPITTPHASTSLFTRLIAGLLLTVATDGDAVDCSRTCRFHHLLVRSTPGSDDPREFGVSYCNPQCASR